MLHVILKISYLHVSMSPQVTGGKECTCNAGDTGTVPGSGRPPGEGNDNPLQYSCLENTMDRGAWWVTVDEATKSWTELSDQVHIHVSVT